MATIIDRTTPLSTLLELGKTKRFRQFEAAEGEARLAEVDVQRHGLIERETTEGRLSAGRRDINLKAIAAKRRTAFEGGDRELFKDDGTPVDPFNPREVDEAIAAGRTRLVDRGTGSTVGETRAPGVTGGVTTGVAPRTTKPVFDVAARPLEGPSFFEESRRRQKSAARATQEPTQEPSFLFRGGGRVPGVDTGEDRVVATLRPEEFVLTPAAKRKLERQGVDLDRLNQESDIEEAVAAGVQHFVHGGEVKKKQAPFSIMGATNAPQRISFRPAAVIDPEPHPDPSALTARELSGEIGELPPIEDVLPGQPLPVQVQPTPLEAASIVSDVPLTPERPPVSEPPIQPQPAREPIQLFDPTRAPVRGLQPSDSDRFLTEDAARILQRQRLQDIEAAKRQLAAKRGIVDEATIQGTSLSELLDADLKFNLDANILAGREALALEVERRNIGRFDDVLNNSDEAIRLIEEDDARIKRLAALTEAQAAAVPILSPDEAAAATGRRLVEARGAAVGIEQATAKAEAIGLTRGDETPEAFIQNVNDATADLVNRATARTLQQSEGFNEVRAFAQGAATSANIESLIKQRTIAVKKSYDDLVGKAFNRIDPEFWDSLSTEAQNRLPTGSIQGVAKVNEQQMKALVQELPKEKRAEFQVFFRQALTDIDLLAGEGLLEVGDPAEIKKLTQDILSAHGELRGFIQTAAGARAVATEAEIVGGIKARGITTPTPKEIGRAVAAELTEEEIAEGGVGVADFPSQEELDGMSVKELEALSKTKGLNAQQIDILGEAKIATKAVAAPKFITPGLGIPDDIIEEEVEVTAQDIAESRGRGRPNIWDYLRTLDYDIPEAFETIDISLTEGIRQIAFFLGVPFVDDPLNDPYFGLSRSEIEFLFRLQKDPGILSKLDKKQKKALFDNINSRFAKIPDHYTEKNRKWAESLLEITKSSK